MEYKLFSELIIKLRIKPDPIITNKIDEIDFPLKNISFIKKDINNFMFQSFENLINKHKFLNNNEKDLVNEFGSEHNTKIITDSNIFNLICKKNKKECPIPKLPSIKNFELELFTDDFIDEINKHYILLCLVFGISLGKTIEFIEKNSTEYNLNSRFIINEILSFWTNVFKNDCCYFDDIELNDENITIEEREIEFCILKFMFNYYKKFILKQTFIDLKQKEIINYIINDKLNFKWYVIFGWAIWGRIHDKINSPDETFEEGLRKFVELNYEWMSKGLDNCINHS